MSDVTPPSDPFSRPPQVTPSAPSAGPTRTTPWKLIIGAVAVIAAVIVGIVVFTGGDDEPGSSTPGGHGGPVVSGEWHLMRLDEAGVSVLNADGAVERTVTLPEDFMPAMAPTMGRWLVGEPDGTSLTVIDLADGTARTLELPGADMVVDRGTLRTGGSVVVFFTPAGGPLARVDLASGTVSPMGANERYGQIGPRPGFSLYVSFGEPATLIVPVDDPAAAWEVPGGVADVRGSETLVVQTEDFASTVSRLDGTEQQGKAVAFEVRIDGGMLSADGAVVIDTGGGIQALDFTAGTHELLGTIGFGVDVVVPIGTDHLLAWGGSGTAIVAADGSVDQTVDPAPDADGELQPLQPVPGGVGSQCLALQFGDGLKAEGARASLWDIATRTQLVKLEATPQLVGIDGCSVVTLGNPAQLVIDGALVDLGLTGVQTVSPDHTQVIGRVEGADGSPAMVLVTVADGAQVPLEMGAHFYANF